MLENLSVRKPFTVLVGVILILVLGVISFMETSTDLLPEMDLPYSAVITTYIGATPEQVEREITIPMETRMSTLSGIEMVQSISNEHVSIIILQFAESTNMDSASLEMRETLDMLTLPDGAGKPMTIRMNPEMLPIMSAAVHMEGATIHELSEFAKYDISDAIEGVPGVAVVSLSGLVQNQLHVVIDSERIEAVNAGLSQAVTNMMEAMMAEMAAQAEAIVTAQVQEYSQTRMAELMTGGLSQEAAGMQLQAELPAVIEAISQEVMEAFAAEHGGERDTESETAIGLPAEMLSVDTIFGVLSAQNFAMPAGMIVEDDDLEYMVRVGDRFESIDDIRNMLIFDPGMMGLTGVDPVRLSDIADVFETDDSHLSYTRVNGNPGVMLTIQKQSGYPTADVTHAVRERMDTLIEENPELGFAVLMDQGEMVDMVIGSVLSNLIYGGLLAMIIILLFLRDIRPTLIVAVSIPVSLLLAFTLMYFSGISLNMMSMGGLALAVGMLVDNSIVVIENIYRMRSTTDRSAARAAISGVKQVSGALVASTITTVVVFIPIIFTGGLARQLFVDFSLTIAYSLLASLIIAFTVVPAAASTILKNVRKEYEGKFFNRFLDGYEAVLRFALRFKVLVILFGVAAFALSFWAVYRRGMELIPNMEAPQITASAEMPADSTFEDTVAVAEVLSSRILEINGVDTVGVSVGGGGMMAMLGGGGLLGGMGGGGTNITMYILLEEGRALTNEELNTQIREIGEELGVEASVMGEDGGLSMLTGSPISLRVEGREFDDIRDTAIAVAELVNSVEGAINVTDMAERAAPELRIRVDKDLAMANGLTVAQVFMAVNGAITAPEKTVNMTLSGTSYEIVVSDGDFEMPDSAGIENLQIETPSGEYVTLSDIAEVYEDIGFTTIIRRNRIRNVTVNGEIEDGYNVTLVNNEIERLLEDFVPAPGCHVYISGEAEAIADAFGDMTLMLVLGLVFIYLIMVAQFQSVFSPFIILFTVPLGFTGGFIALLITGAPLSIVAMIGLILLMGVIVNNGILIISRINQMRWEGMSKKDAIIDSGRKRLRPILMTALTTIIAMSLMAVGMGEGSEMMQPMAVTTVGGLLYGTTMTLFFIPAMYDLLNRNKDITKENLDVIDDE